MRNALWITSAQRYSFGRFINERDQITKPQALAMANVRRTLWIAIYTNQNDDDKYFLGRRVCGPHTYFIYVYDLMIKYGLIAIDFCENDRV